jgi:hypothetical protein
MSENQEQKVVPIRRNIKIGPPSRTEVQVVQVDPQLRIVAENKPETEQPEEPNRRQFFLKVFTALFGGLAAIGTTKALQTKTGQDILNASPFTQHPDRRPPVDQQRKEIRQDIESKNSPKNPTGYDPTTLEMMDKIKAQNNTNKSN